MALPLTAADIDKVFESILGQPAREADKALVARLGSTREALAEYLWDHWMGEPTDISVRQVRESIDWVLAIGPAPIYFSGGTRIAKAILVVYRDFIESNGKWRLFWQDAEREGVVRVHFRTRAEAVAYAENAWRITPYRGRGFAGDIE